MYKKNLKFLHLMVKIWLNLNLWSNTNKEENKLALYDFINQVFISSGEHNLLYLQAIFQSHIFIHSKNFSPNFFSQKNSKRFFWWDNPILGFSPQLFHYLGRFFISFVFAVELRLSRNIPKHSEHSWIFQKTPKNEV